MEHLALYVFQTKAPPCSSAMALSNALKNLKSNEKALGNPKLIWLVDVAGFKHDCYIFPGIQFDNSFQITRLMI